MTALSSSRSSSSTIHPSERTPLLSTATNSLQIEDESDGSLSDADTIRDEEALNLKAEPKRWSTTYRVQILLLCLARIIEPLAFTSIFPYIAEMVQRNGDLPSSNIGFYSGVIESIFSASQGIFLIFWRIYANRYGSKRMLVYSLVGIAVGQAMFSMSKNIWQMILFRSLTGAFSSSNLLIRMMIGEMCTRETQAKAFSWYSIAGNVGIMFGPVIGGGLVEPVRQYPFIFRGSWFLEKFPFALSGLVIAAFSATAAVISQIFLKETSGQTNLPPELEYNPEAMHVYSNVSSWHLLKVREISGAFWSHAHVMVCWTAINALLPVVLYTPIALSGWELSQAQITISLSALGIGDAIWMFFVFPKLQRRIGTKGILQTGAVMWPAFSAGFVLVSVLLRREAVTAAIIVAVFMGTVGTAIGMSFTAAQLAVNEACPIPELLGKLNYLAELSISVIRSTIPVITTTMFAIGVRDQIFSGYLALSILILFSLVFPFILTRVKKS